MSHFSKTFLVIIFIFIFNNCQTNEISDNQSLIGKFPYKNEEQIDNSWPEDELSPPESSSESYDDSLTTTDAFTDLAETTPEETNPEETTPEETNPEETSPEPTTSTTSTETPSKPTSSPTPTKYTRTTRTKPTKPTKPTTTTTTTPKRYCNGSYDGKFNWPSVEVGQSSCAECPEGNGHAYWKCLDNAKFDESGPDSAECKDVLGTMPEIENLDDAIDYVVLVSNITENINTIVESEKLEKVMNILTQVQTQVDNITDSTHNNLTNVKNYTSNIVGTYSNIIEQKNAWINSTAEQKTDIASKILLNIQYSSFTLVCQQKDINKVEVIKNGNIYINTFITNSTEKIVFPKNTRNSSITIPSGTTFNETCVKCNNTAIGAVIDNIQEYLLGGINEYQEINSGVLSFSVTNRTSPIKLSSEVTIKMKHKSKLQFGDKIECVFWDFDNSSWRTNGCYKVEEESDRIHTVCKCNHLTNFAALMDVSGRESNDQLKSILSYCCGVLSIIGLILTINLILRSKNTIETSSRKANLNEMRSIITCNLCVCLLITNILVVFGMDRTNITWLCQISSGSLLYSLLASFCWMLLEGNYLYKTLVSCFSSDFNRPLLYGFGYGAPIIICIIGFIAIHIKENIFFEALYDERYSYFCWISSAHYPNHIWIVVAPAVCIIFLNALLMFVSLKTAFNVMKNYKSFAISSEEKSRATLKQIISFVFISFLLGITWISFLLYIHQTFFFDFSYFFIVLNGSQGFFIFLYHLSIDECNSRKNSRETSSVSKY